MPRYKFVVFYVENGYTGRHQPACYSGRQSLNLDCLNLEEHSFFVTRPSPLLLLVLFYNVSKIFFKDFSPVSSLLCFQYLHTDHPL
jgi:hypothetical protein